MTLQGLLSRLFRGPPKVPRHVRETLQIQHQVSLWGKHKWRRGAPKFVKGVANGNYFRVKIPPKQKQQPSVPKLPSSPPMPKPLSPPKASIQTTRGLKGWLKSNWAVLVLNFGSICTLIGFTRSDVLELRSLSLTGNIMSITYLLQQNPILWINIGWSSMFSLVNSWKIVEIIHERNAQVHMNEEQQEVYVCYFMSHGVTPKQFERLLAKAKKMKFKQGDVLVRSGEKLEHVYLIIGGATKALSLGRFVTAASTNSDTRGDQKAGGDSGAWVGEMAFLDRLWELEQGKTTTSNSTTPAATGDKSTGEAISSKKALGVAIYTILCDEDCTVLSWSHEDMAELMRSSADLRGALTRAMTSALVGKVVNLTVSRTQKGLPLWSSWLSGGTSFGGASVQVKDEPEEKQQLRGEEPALKPSEAA